MTCAAPLTINTLVDHPQTPQDPAWGNHDFDFSEMFLGVGNSPTELLPSRSARRGQGQGQESEEAKGRSPLHVTEMYAESVGVMGSVTVGQYAQFVCTTTQQALADAELAYQSCKRRIEREGSVVLSSIHFTCSVRPDRVEVSAYDKSGQCVREVTCGAAARETLSAVGLHDIMHKCEACFRLVTPWRMPRCRCHVQKVSVDAFSMGALG